METRKIEINGRSREITEHGNLLKVRGKGFTSPFKNKEGYLKESVKGVDGVIKKYSTHRLVYEAFHGVIPEGYTVDHIDCDKLNNHYSNLQLLTAEENAVKGNAKHWKFLSPQQEVVEVYNLEEFCRNNGLHPAHMREVHHEKPNYRSHKGWRKSYV